MQGSDAAAARLEPLLAEAGSSLGSALALLESGGRPRLLVFLKETVKIMRLSERQAIANDMSRMLKAGRQGETSVNSGGHYALLQAAAKGDAHTLRAALDGPGGDPNIVRHDGWSALALAARGSFPACVTLLLAHRAINDTAARAGPPTPLLAACEAGASECVALLCAAGAMNSDSTGTATSPLCVASAHGHLMAVDALLNAGADPAAAVLVAASHGRTEILGRLLDVGAPAEQTRGGGGRSAVSLAACGGHEACVSLLLSHGASANTPSGSFHWTPTMWAALYGQSACLQKLLSDVSGDALDGATLVPPPCGYAKPRSGWSALSTAALHGRFECARLLLEARADPSAGRARHLARLGGHYELLRLLGGGEEDCDACGGDGGDEESSCSSDAVASADATRNTRASGEPGASGVHAATAAADGVLTFYLPSDLACDQAWMEWPVVAPFSCRPPSAPYLRYKVSSATLTYANLLQIICRGNGLWRHPHKIGSCEDRCSDGACTGDSGSDDWSIMWLAGRLTPEAFAALRPHQRVSKFACECPLSIKSELWRCYSRAVRHDASMQFMPQTFILPEGRTAWMQAMEEDIATDADAMANHSASDEARRAWIFKPRNAACGTSSYPRFPGSRSWSMPPSRRCSARSRSPTAR